MLKEQVQRELLRFGLTYFKQPIFYNCKYCIRFEIGKGDIYNNNNQLRINYIDNALNRALTIYKLGLQSPEILVWEIYVQYDEEMIKSLNLFADKIIPIQPHEYSSQYVNEDLDVVKKVHFYWNLKKSEIPMEKLFKEIILGDLGGTRNFVSAFYVLDIDNHVMLHLYDDKGLDIVAGKKESILPIYQKLNKWILDFDRKKIDNIFKN